MNGGLDLSSGAASPPESPQSRDAMPDDGVIRFARPMLLVAVAVLLLTTVAQMWVGWKADSMMDHVAGTWATLAADLKNGVFYRPLHGPLGFGGTRYFPLHFVVQAGLMIAGLNVVVAGRLIALLSVVVLAIGIYLLLRALGVQVWLAMAAACLPLATPAGQVLQNVRGDILPAALNVLGLAVAARQAPNRGRLIAASILFTLAFSAKPTTVFGLVTVVSVFLLQRHYKVAWQLLASTMVGYVLVLATIYIGSQGRAYEIFRACALGGASWTSMLKGPLHIATEAAGAQPQNGVAFLVLGFAAFLAWRTDRARLVPPVFLASTALASAVILGTPGAQGNHLLDLYVAAIVIAVVWINHQPRRQMSFGICLLAAATIFVLPEQVATVRQMTAAAWSNGRNPHEITRLVQDPRKPVLAENQLLNLHAGQVPYVLDCFYFRILSERDTSFAEPLWRRLGDQSFAAVVLIGDPRTPQGQYWYQSIAFGPPFLDVLNRSYYLADSTGDQFVFLPRPR